jgi:phosphopantetheinyl transferase
MRLSVWSQRAPDQRRQPELARALLRQAVADEAGRNLPVLHQAGRAPVVERMAVSLARADDVATCVVGSCESVGIDIERLRPWVELADIAPLLSDAPPGDPQGLLSLWTRKEALAKAMGVGLPDDVRALRVPSRSPEVGEWIREDRWLWIGCPCEKGCVASLVVGQEGPDAGGGYDMIEAKDALATRIWLLDVRC